MDYISYTDIGKARERNEDYIYADPTSKIFIIADGMGGHKAGDIASKIAVTVLKEELHKCYLPKEEFLLKAFNEANEEIKKEALTGDKKNMGTTATAVKIVNNKIYLGHIGDSRAYIIRNNLLYKLTNDHTYVDKLYEEGLITYEEYKVHPRKNILLKALGIGDDIEPQILEMSFMDGDILFLCSDGVYQHLESEDILEILKLDNLEEIRDEFKRRIDKEGAYDNYSFIIASNIYREEH